MKAKRDSWPRGRLILSVIWALIPVVTFGFGTSFPFLYAAVRLRSRLLAWCTAAYAAGTTAGYLLVAEAGNRQNWELAVGTVVIVLTAGTGCAHAFAIRREVFGAPGTQQMTLERASERLRLRAQARHIVTTNPRLADELCIGRPDVPRRFDDGGLVDVNHAPAPAIAAVPGIDPALADQIVSTREGIGGFESLDDLSTTLGVQPQALDHVGEYLVFRR